MTTNEITKLLAELCGKEEYETAQKELYADDATSIELMESPMFAKETHGLQNIIEKGHKLVLGVTFPYPDPTWITSDYYGTSVLTGIIGGAHKSGYSTTIFHKPWHDAKNSAGGFRGQGIDGFLVVSPEPTSDMVSGLAALGIPLVVISASSDQFGVPSVDIDNGKGVRLGLAHLLALGHRRIAHIMDSDTRYDNERRRDAFLAVLAESDIAVPPEFMQIINTNLEGRRSFYHAARSLLTLPNPPTALFTSDDCVAMEALEAAHDLGIAVPERLSIIGFDDHPETKRVTPALTTIRQPLVEMGKTAATMLISLVEGKEVLVRTHLFEPELIVRGSTAPPGM